METALCSGIFGVRVEPGETLRVLDSNIWPPGPVLNGSVNTSSKRQILALWSWSYFLNMGAL